jgi:hypothetical protein
MSIAKTRFALSVAAVSVGAFVLATTAAEAQRKQSARGSSAARDAAVSTCIAKVQSEMPFVVPNPETSQRRVAIYKACMTQAGFRP